MNSKDDIRLPNHTERNIRVLSVSAILIGCMIILMTVHVWYPMFKEHVRKQLHEEIVSTIRDSDTYTVIYDDPQTTIARDKYGVLYTIVLPGKEIIE